MKKKAPPWVLLAQCEGKHAFESAALAMAVAKRGSRSKEAAVNAYHCPHCGAWHIGSGRFNKLLKKPKSKS